MPARKPPDADSRQRLLRAGVTLARRKGLRTMTVRAVAAQAKANLGSFVYHFGSRDAFVEELIEHLYAPLFARLELEAATGGSALEQLRHVMLRLVAWLVEQRGFIAHLLLDAGAGEAGVKRFLRTLDRRHPALVLTLIVRAQQAGQLRRDEPMHQLLFLMSTMAAPVLLLHLAGRHGIAARQFVRTMDAFATEPAQVATRLDWALRALAADPPPEARR